MEKITLNKITVLGFGGSSILENQVTFLILIKNLPTLSYSGRSVCDDLSCGHRERY
jgi:hypothetical protein